MTTPCISSTLFWASRAIQCLAPDAKIHTSRKEVCVCASSTMLRGHVHPSVPKSSRAFGLSSIEALTSRAGLRAEPRQRAELRCRCKTSTIIHLLSIMSFDTTRKFLLRVVAALEAPIIVNWPVQGSAHFWLLRQKLGRISNTSPRLFSVPYSLFGHPYHDPIWHRLRPSALFSSQSGHELLVLRHLTLALHPPPRFRRAFASE